MKTKNLVLAALCASLVGAPALHANKPKTDHQHEIAGFRSNGLYIFAAAFVASTISYKLFGMGLDSSKELAKSAESSIEKQLKLKNKKSPEAKDVLKNIAEKGLYVGITLITGAILKKQLKDRLGFDLEETVFGKCAHAGCSQAK
jgi:hypothetical protein